MNNNNNIEEMNTTNYESELRFFDCHRIKAKSNKNVLLVEDERAIRDLISPVLKRAGYKVIEVSNGKQALDVFDKFKSKFDLIISDMNLPGMNGDKLASIILKNKPEIKILFISGISLKIMKNIFDHKKIEYLEKPFSLDQLLKKVEFLLNR